MSQDIEMRPVWKADQKLEAEDERYSVTVAASLCTCVSLV